MIETPSRAASETSAGRPGLRAKRLVFVCGKGGVGKTTIACALAVALARQGKRVLLAGIHSTDQISRYFGMPTLGLREIELEPRLHALHLDEQLIFDSYIRKTFKLKPIYKRILDSPIYQYFTAAAPGIKELIVLDTIQELFDRERPRFDHILVDCPATGHGLSYLNVGNQALRTFSIGPLRKKAEGIQALLTNPLSTGVLLVTLAEEMPVNETLELHAAIRSRLRLSVDGLVVNGLFPPLQPGLDPAVLEGLSQDAPGGNRLPWTQGLAEAARFYQARSQINGQHLSRLVSELQIPRFEVPFLADESRDLGFLLEVGSYLGVKG